MAEYCSQHWSCLLYQAEKIKDISYKPCSKGQWKKTLITVNGKLIKTGFVFKKLHRFLISQFTQIFQIHDLIWFSHQLYEENKDNYYYSHLPWESRFKYYTTLKDTRQLQSGKKALLYLRNGMMYLKEQDVKKKKKGKQIQELLLGSAVRKRGKQDSRQMCEWRQGRVLLKQGHGFRKL